LKRTIIVLLAIAATTVVAVFAAFVWPTEFRYDRITYNIPYRGPTTCLVRINRFNGDIEKLDPRHGWMPIP
jgi:hypothetical protein